MESQIWHLPVSSVALWWWRAQKRDNGLCQPLFPPALVLIPDTWVSPCTAQVPFKLLPWCWSSEIMSLNKSVCDLVKRNCLGHRSFFHWLNPCWFLQPEVMGTYLPGSGTLGWGAWCGAGTPGSWDIPPIFSYSTCGFGTSPFSVFASPTSLDGFFFLIL